MNIEYIAELPLKGLTIGHIHKDPLPGPVNTQLFPLFVYMGDHLMCMFHGIRLHVPHTAIDLFKCLADVGMEYRGSRCGKGYSEHSVYA